MRHPLKSITRNALVILAAFGLLLNSSIPLPKPLAGHLMAKRQLYKRKSLMAHGMD